LITALRPRLIALFSDSEAARFIESWRLLALLFERGEPVQVRTRTRRPLEQNVDGRGAGDHRHGS
jgi:hypothetical protein